MLLRPLAFATCAPIAAWIAIFLTLLIRVLAVRFNWTTRAFGWWHARGDDDPDKRR